MSFNNGKITANSAQTHDRMPMQQFSMRRAIRRACQSWLPLPWFMLQYRRSSTKVKSAEPRAKLFERFLEATSGDCLQIAVKDEIARKFGPNWTSVDKYDHSSIIDRHDDIEELQFPDNSFNAIVCWSVLEHVPGPQRAIAEMHRVLKPNGQIWVQLPFLFPYHADPDDFWRVTPNGLRIWMEAFDETACGCDYWARTRLIAATFFWGTKRSA